MPFTKIFGTADGPYSTATSWRPVSLRTSAFSWTLSGSGTSEYYCRTAANGNPGFQAAPSNVYLDGTNATSGSVGSLVASRWAYGDNDTLGYNTVYVRTSGSVDPDTLRADYVEFYQIPQATEHVRFAADSASPTAATVALAGLDQSAVAIGDFIVEEGCEAQFGSTALGNLRIDPDRLEYYGNGQAWIDIGTAAIKVVVGNTGSATQGELGLYLKGSAVTVLDIRAGEVGFAALPGDTGAITTAARVMGPKATLVLGSGNSTVPLLHQYGGVSRVRCAVTAAILYDGRMWSEEAAAMATITQYGGEMVDMSTAGVATAYNLHGGTLDMSKNGSARTYAALKKYRGSWRILRNKEAVTITAETAEETYNESGSV